MSANQLLLAVNSANWLGVVFLMTAVHHPLQHLITHISSVPSPNCIIPSMVRRIFDVLHGYILWLFDMSVGPKGDHV